MYHGEEAMVASSMALSAINEVLQEKRKIDEMNMLVAIERERKTKKGKEHQILLEETMVSACV